MATGEKVFYAIADVTNPNPEPFALIAIYPERRADDGCEGIIVSLHMEKAQADAALEASETVN